jgi:hypothetical protein
MQASRFGAASLKNHPQHRMSLPGVSDHGPVLGFLSGTELFDRDGIKENSRLDMWIRQ